MHIWHDSVPFACRPFQQTPWACAEEWRGSHRSRRMLHSERPKWHRMDAVPFMESRSYIQGNEHCWANMAWRQACGACKLGKATTCTIFVIWRLVAKLPFIPEFVTTVNWNQLPSLPTSKFEILLLICATGHVPQPVHHILRLWLALISSVQANSDLEFQIKLAVNTAYHIQWEPRKHAWNLTIVHLTYIKGNSNFDSVPVYRKCDSNWQISVYWCSISSFCAN